MWPQIGFGERICGGQKLVGEEHQGRWRWVIVLTQNQRFGLALACSVPGSSADGLIPGGFFHTIQFPKLDAVERPACARAGGRLL